MQTETPQSVDRAENYRLTPDEITKFRAQGFIGPFKLYEPDEARDRYRQIRAQLFDREYAAYDLPATSMIANYDRHLDVNLLTEHIGRPEIVGRLNSVLGPDIICWRSEMFPKYPGDEGTDWHQADTFAHASGKPQIVWPGDTRFGGAVTVWTALTESNEANGCLRFMPGTHEEMFYDESKGMKFDPTAVNAVEKDGIKRGFYGYDYRNLQKDPDWKPDESKAVSMIMQPGEFVMFWSTLMHSSYPNTTKDKTRLGYTSRYIPTAVKVYPDTDTVEEYGNKISLDKFGVVLVSGEDHYGHNRRVETNARGVRFTHSSRS
jgi:non-heme Fe2+,alpha-ketoglutarate-dependent halogenase